MSPPSSGSQNKQAGNQPEAILLVNCFRLVYCVSLFDPEDGGETTVDLKRTAQSSYILEDKTLAYNSVFYFLGNSTSGHLFQDSLRNEFF
jgi:hypothetical protein